MADIPTPSGSPIRSEDLSQAWFREMGAAALSGGKTLKQELSIEFRDGSKHHPVLGEQAEKMFHALREAGVKVTWIKADGRVEFLNPKG